MEDELRRRQRRAGGLDWTAGDENAKHNAGIKCISGGETLGEFMLCKDTDVMDAYSA
jgi:hypothetical protein